MKARLECAIARKARSGRAAKRRRAARAAAARPARKAARAPAASKVPASKAQGDPLNASAHHSTLLFKADVNFYALIKYVISYLNIPIWIID